MSSKLPVVIYRHHLLAPSETFVRGQAEALKQFSPYYLGSRRLVPSLQLPEERTLVLHRGGLQGALSKVFYNFWGLAPTLMRRIREINPVLIHAHFGPDGVLVMPLARALKLPLLVTFHGFDASVKHEDAKPSFGRWIYLHRREKLKREAQLFIAVSQAVKEKLLDQGFPPDKIVVHYIGVDTELFQPDPMVKRKPIVLFVGRLVEKKGCEYLIQSMSKVQAIIPEVELIIIGDGPLRASLEELAGKTLQRYRFLGVQPPDSVRHWMNQSQVFSVPSVTAKSGDLEGFGLVFAEAQAMGLPIVSFSTGGIPEAVAHDETGFLASERNSEELAAYILRLLEDQVLWQRFSQKGQQRVQTLFNLHTQTLALESIYENRVLRGNS